MIKQTHTYAYLSISEKAYDEIKHRLIAAGYESDCVLHPIGRQQEEECVILPSIALTRGETSKVDPCPPERRSDVTR